MYNYLNVCYLVLCSYLCSCAQMHFYGVDLKNTLKLFENYLSVCVCAYMFMLQLLN